MAFDLSGWLDDDSWRITGVASEKHPDGGSYAIPCPSIRDTALLRRITSGYERIIDAENAAKAAATKGDIDTQQARATEMAALLNDNETDLCTYLGVAKVEDLGPDADIQELMQRKLLGPIYDQMVTDGVSSTRMDRVYQATVVRFTQNEEVVRLLVDFEGKAQALDNRATRRAAKKAPAKAAARNFSPRATSRSSRASSATKGRSADQASTRSSKTSAATATKQTA